MLNKGKIIEEFSSAYWTFEIIAFVYRLKQTYFIMLNKLVEEFEWLIITISTDQS